MKNFKDMNVDELILCLKKAEKQTRKIDTASKCEEIIGPGIQGGAFFAGTGLLIGGEVLNDFNLVKTSAIFGLAFAAVTGMRAFAGKVFNKLEKRNKQLRDELDGLIMRKKIEEKD